MSEWKQIEIPPENPTPVLLFYPNLPGEYDWPTEIYGGPREERVAIGWWDGESFRVNGTGHEAYEDWWMPPANAPTHWMPLPKPPCPADTSKPTGKA